LYVIIYFIDVANTVAGMEKGELEHVEQSQNQPIQEILTPLALTEAGNYQQEIPPLFI
jgi:hypothetical protein